MAIVTTDLGKVMITPKGIYDPFITYSILDLIEYDGGSYISRVNNNIASLVDINSWQAIGKKGDMGRSIISNELISTVGLIKTYRITYTDSTTFEYSVSDGAVGKSQYQSYLETTTDEPPLSEAAWASFLRDLYDLVNILLPENAMITSSGNYVVSKDKKYLITI